jgi:two-component system phosphate regulon sensor histidine kinase PhoR
MPTGLLIVYIITGVLGVGIAILLAHVARLSGQARLTQKQGFRDSYLSSDIVNDDSLNKIILEEIREVVESERNAREIGAKMSDIIAREVSKRIEINAAELTNKFDKVIKEKSMNEDMARKKYKKVLTEKKNTDAVIRSIAEGLVVVDSKGKVIMMNPAAERILGSSSKDKIGKPIDENIRNEQLVSMVTTADDEDMKEIELVSPEDETKKIIRASSAVIESEDGSTIGMVSVLSDITKQKELDRMKQAFVASVSHELRTPLVAIEKSISLILTKTTGPLSADQQQFLGIADRNLKRLTRLINDLLDMSKLEAGRMQLKVQEGHLEKVILESIDPLSTWANTPGVTIKSEIQSDMPPITFDPDRIIQVLTNLIGNAIKFTPQGGTITVSAGVNAASGDAQVSVEDSGIGIPPESISKVFDKFYQVGERTPSDIGGTGLGLSIAKEIVALHGGKIWTESEHGMGAKFTFALPMK